MFSFFLLFLGFIYHETAPRRHTHTDATATSTCSWGGTSNWHGEDGEGATMKRRRATTTKIMSQDDIDTVNEGTDDNSNGIRGQTPTTRNSMRRPPQDDDRDGDGDVQQQPHDQIGSGAR